MGYEIDGNTALVTASSAGLGRASAVALAREGANVVVNGRDRESLNETVAYLDEKGRGDVIGITADLTNRDDVERLVHETVGEFGGLDHLVTSAGPPKWVVSGNNGRGLVYGVRPSRYERCANCQGGRRTPVRR